MCVVVDAVCLEELHLLLSHCRVTTRQISLGSNSTTVCLRRRLRRRRARGRHRPLRRLRVLCRLYLHVLLHDGSLLRDDLASHLLNRVVAACQRRLQLRDLLRWVLLLCQGATAMYSTSGKPGRRRDESPAVVRQRVRTAGVGHCLRGQRCPGARRVQGQGCPGGRRRGQLHVS